MGTGRRQAEHMDNNGEILFGIRTVFPNAEALFNHLLQSLKKIKQDCFVVLDSNVLLFPHNIETILDQIVVIYRQLIEQKRLMLPGQVPRGFVKNRGNKYQNCSNKHP